MDKNNLREYFIPFDLKDIGPEYRPEGNVTVWVMKNVHREDPPLVKRINKNIYLFEDLLNKNTRIMYYDEAIRYGMDIQVVDIVFSSLVDAIGWLKIFGQDIPPLEAFNPLSPMIKV